MNFKAIFSDKNYNYIAIGILTALVGTLALKQYFGNGQPKEVMGYAIIIIGTILAYQTARMYLYSRQFAKTPIKNKAGK